MEYKINDIVQWEVTTIHKADSMLKEIYEQDKIPYTENDGKYFWTRILTGQIIEVFDNRVTVTYIGSQGIIVKSNAHKRTILKADIINVIKI